MLCPIAVFEAEVAQGRAQASFQIVSASLGKTETHAARNEFTRLGEQRRGDDRCSILQPYSLRAFARVLSSSSERNLSTSWIKSIPSLSFTTPSTYSSPGVISVASVISRSEISMTPLPSQPELLPSVSMCAR